MSNLFFHFGRYLHLLWELFKTPERAKTYYQRSLVEMVSMISGSAFIVIVISTFIGGVTTLQSAYQLANSPLVPKSTIGSVVSASTLLELAPTVLTFILAGRIGSSIASEIGTMRVTEQIDALEVMGINAASFLIIPKIIGTLIAFPILVTFAAFLSTFGGLAAGDITGAVPAQDFTLGLQTYFDAYQVVVMYTKAFVFGFIVASVSSYHGYYTYGGSLEVGQSSTKAVVYSCLAVVVADYVIAQIML